METRTQAVDRVLEALSPALASELERIVNETRQAIEAECERRLQSAVQDAEESARNAAEIERHHAVDRAVEETRQSVQQKITQELQAQFTKTLGERDNDLNTTRDEFSRLRDDFQKRQNEWNSERQQLQSERDRLQKDGERWRVFAEAQQALTESTSQPELLLRWLKLAEPFAASVAIYRIKGDGLTLWKSRGKTVFPDIISQQTTDPESFFKPMIVRGKTVAAVCALPPYRTDVLDFLAGAMQRAIEHIGLKLAYRTAP